jgi:DprA/Smf-like nucleotide binding protein involved in DNA uptake
MIDDIVENTGLNSSDVLATLFDLEMKGFVPQLPGKLFSQASQFRLPERVSYCFILRWAIR